MKEFCCKGTLMACAFTFLTSGSALAATIEIGFLGLDLVYDGDVISDTGALGGGVGDPADADPIDAVTVEVDGVLAGPVLTDDVFLDVSIPVEIPVPASPGVTSADSDFGFFDLLVGPTASAFSLALDIDEVSITFVDAVTAQFVFGAEVTSDVFSQDLPFGLIIGTPVNLTFNATITPGSLTDDGALITGFGASGGSGTFTGESVPEPSALLLGLCAAFGFAHTRRR